MIRRMRYGAAILIMACMVAVMMPVQMLTAFAAGAKITFSDPSATVGGKFTVNMKITSSSNLANADVMLAYDANALEFVEGTNASGDAGAIRVHGDAGTPNTGTLAFTLQFNAKTAGSSKITITSQEIYDSSSQIVNVDHQGSSTVTVSALQTASKDATLKSLKVSPGELTPAFSPDVDTYAVTVGTDVEKVLISANTTDANASVIIAGSEGLQMGENRVTCKVTAQDGETAKEYVIVVTKAEGGASAASADTSSQVKMEISRRVITILPPDESVAVPKGFKASTINIDGHKVQGWVWGAETEHQYCVVYGMNEAGEKNFYRYDMKDNERTIQRYFEDPAMTDMVDKDIYNNLATEYDKVCEDFSLFRILLIVTVVIALVLLIILLVVVLNKKGKDDGYGGDGSHGAGGSRAKASARKGKQIPEDDEGYDGTDGAYEDGADDVYEDEDGFYEDDVYGSEDDDAYGNEPDDIYEDEAGYEDGPEDAYEDRRRREYQMGYEDPERYDAGEEDGSADGYGDSRAYAAAAREPAGRPAARRQSGRGTNETPREPVRSMPKAEIPKTGGDVKKSPEEDSDFEIFDL